MVALFNPSCAENGNPSLDGSCWIGTFRPECRTRYQCDAARVYHEHLCYYSLHALQALYGRFGFVITNVQFMPMHGGAIRVFARRANSAKRVYPVVDETLERERSLGLHRLETYTMLGRQVEEYRDRLTAGKSVPRKRLHSLTAPQLP